MGITIPSWVTPDRIAALNALFTACPDLGNSLSLKSTELWHIWSTSPQARRAVWPDQHHSSASQCETEFAAEIRRKLKPFQLLLVVQALRPDRLQSAMQQLACQLLGRQE